MAMRWKRALLIVAIGSAFSASQSTGAEADFPTRFPAAGVALEPLLARLHPDTSSRVVRKLPRFRADHQFQIVLALSSRRRANGTRWYLLSLPGPPNGALGWVPADAVDVRPVASRIIVRLAARRIEVRRVADGKLLCACERIHRKQNEGWRDGDGGTRPRDRRARARQRRPVDCQDEEVAAAVRRWLSDVVA